MQQKRQWVWAHTRERANICTFSIKARRRAPLHHSFSIIFFAPQKKQRRKKLCRKLINFLLCIVLGSLARAWLWLFGSYLRHVSVSGSARLKERCEFARHFTHGSNGDLGGERNGHLCRSISKSRNFVATFFSLSFLLAPTDLIQFFYPLVRFGVVLLGNSFNKIYLILRERAHTHIPRI